MSTLPDHPKHIHQGRNVKRFREMLGLKQEVLAMALGEEWTQKKVSQLEAKDVIEAELLAEVAKALHIPEDAIKNLDEEKAVNIIANNFSDDSNLVAYTENYKCSVNPIDKLIEVYEENKKLYERLLASEQEKVEILKRSIK